MFFLDWFRKPVEVVSSITRSLLQYFSTGRASEDARVALEYVGKALPFIVIAGDCITSLTPTKFDDVAWAAIKVKYPSILDGREKTADELKHAALAIATELMLGRYPQLSTSVAKAAVQLAYLDYKNIPEVMRPEGK